MKKSASGERKVGQGRYRYRSLRRLNSPYHVSINPIGHCINSGTPGTDSGAGTCHDIQIMATDIELGTAAPPLASAAMRSPS